MFSLSYKLDETVVIEGEEYPLNLYFDTVLRFYDLMDDETIDEYEKIEIAFEMFFGHEASYKLDFDTKFKTIEKVSEMYIMGVDGEEAEGEGENDVGNSEKLYDLTEDAPYIYSSFLQEYGIDLIDMQGKLRWEKFNALLMGLRDKTKFKEIVGIRGAELPKDKEERKRLRELKRIYALKSNKSTKDQELEQMFNYLYNKAEEKNV